MEKFQSFWVLKRRVVEKASEYFSGIVLPRDLEEVYERFAEAFGLGVQVMKDDPADYSTFSKVKIFNRDKSEDPLTAVRWEIFPLYCERFLIFDPQEEPHRTRTFVEGLREMYPELSEETDQLYFLLENGDALFPLFLDKMKESYISLDMFPDFRFIIDAMEDYVRNVRNEYVKSYFLHLLVWFYLFLYLRRVSKVKTVLFVHRNTPDSRLKVQDGLDKLLAYFELGDGDDLTSVLPSRLPHTIVLAGAPIGLDISLSSKEYLRPHEIDHAIPLSDKRYLNTLQNDFCALVPALAIRLV